MKKLIATHFESAKSSYKLELISNKNKKITKLDIIKTPLKQNGDFRSPECIEILKEADVVITNPPFSLFREYVALLNEHAKKFLILGNQTAITYKEMFNLIKENRIWLGYKSGDMEFQVPDYYEPRATRYRVSEDGIKYRSFGNMCWFTNIDIKKRHEDLLLYKKYNPTEYPKYDKYDAINVDKTKDIPIDYSGYMGVPITFLDKYNPEQFQIIALGIVGSIEFTCNKKMEILDKLGIPTGKFTHNAKGTLYCKFDSKFSKVPAFRDYETGELYSSIYARIIIKNKKVVR